MVYIKQRFRALFSWMAKLSVIALGKCVRNFNFCKNNDLTCILCSLIKFQIVIFISDDNHSYYGEN